MAKKQTKKAGAKVAPAKKKSTKKTSPAKKKARQDEEEDEEETPKKKKKNGGYEPDDDEVSNNDSDEDEEEETEDDEEDEQPKKKVKTVAGKSKVKLPTGVGNPEKTYRQIRDLVELMDEDFDRFLVNETRAAGRRLRGYLQQVKKNCQTLRKEIQLLQNERKNQTQKGKK
jgi:hypothetical protein